MTKIEEIIKFLKENYILNENAEQVLAATISYTVDFLEEKYELTRKD